MFCILPSYRHDRDGNDTEKIPLMKSFLPTWLRKKDPDAYWIAPYITPAPTKILSRLREGEFMLRKSLWQASTYEIWFKRGRRSRFVPIRNCKADVGAGFKIDTTAFKTALAALDALLQLPLQWDRRMSLKENHAVYCPSVLHHRRDDSENNLYFRRGGKNYLIHPDLIISLAPGEEPSYTSIEKRLHAKYGTFGSHTPEPRIHFIDPHALEWLIAHGHLMPGTTSAQLAERRARFQHIVRINLIFILFERACPMDRFVDFSQLKHEQLPPSPFLANTIPQGQETSIAIDSAPAFPFDTLVLAREGAWRDAHYEIDLNFSTSTAQFYCMRNCMHYSPIEIKVDPARLLEIAHLLGRLIGSGIDLDFLWIEDQNLSYDMSFVNGRWRDSLVYESKSKLTFQTAGFSFKISDTAAPPYSRLPINMRDWIHKHFSQEDYRVAEFPNHSLDANAIEWMSMRKTLDFQILCDTIERCIQLADYVDVSQRPKQSWTRRELEEIASDLPQPKSPNWLQQLRGLFFPEKVRDPRWPTYPFAAHPQLPAWNTARFGYLQIETMNALYSAHYTIELSAGKGSRIDCHYHCRQEGSFALVPDDAQLDTALALLAEWVTAHPIWDKSCLEKLNFKDFFADPIQQYDRVDDYIFYRMRLSIDGQNYQVRSPFHLSFPSDVPLSFKSVADGLHAAFGTLGEDGITRRIHAMDAHPLAWLVGQGHQPLGTTDAELEVRRAQFQQVASFNYISALLERAWHIEDFVGTSQPA